MCDAGTAMPATPVFGDNWGKPPLRNFTLDLQSLEIDVYIPESS